MTEAGYPNPLIPGFYPDPSVVKVGSAAGSEKHELARLDGRYLSQETAASFTGRVLGLYAVDGDVAFSGFRYSGVES
jgi:beta-xylosidase